MTKFIGWLCAGLVVTILTAGVLAPDITGRSLVVGKTAALLGGITDVAVEVLNAVQDGLQKVGGEEDTTTDTTG